MIISSLHKFIFAAIPKTGTHSIRRALREQMGADDQEQVGLFVQRKLAVPELARLQHGHITLHQLQPFLAADQFDTAFKFAFVRNPFDRFVSYCAFMTRDRDVFAREPGSVMRRFLASPPHQHVLFQPQHRFVAGVDGELLTDYIGRVEAMQESYDEACGRIGIPSSMLGKVNVTQRGDYRQYFDQQLIDAVANLYARDLELFGYDF